MDATLCSSAGASSIPTRKPTPSSLLQKERPYRRWLRPLAHAGTSKRMRENAKDLGLDQDARSVLHRLVSTHHAGAAGSCRLSRDLCNGALLHLSSCSISASRSLCRARGFPSQKCAICLHSSSGP